MSCPLKTYFPFLDYQMVRTFGTLLVAFFAYFKGFFDYFDIGLGCGGGPIFLLLCALFVTYTVFSLRRRAATNASIISTVDTLPMKELIHKKD